MELIMNMDQLKNTLIIINLNISASQLLASLLRKASVLLLENAACVPLLASLDQSVTNMY